MGNAAQFDLIVVGGGINGCGIARDAAGRGLRVLLVEKDDLAAHTSSASTKLIHGGLRYLEHLEFKLVRESLIERERLLRIAPHLVRLMEFVVPQASSQRPAWLIRLGLVIYDYLGGTGTLPRTRTISLESDGRGDGLSTPSGKALVYSDCVVDDSRLAILNAVDAQERGAEIRTRTELIAARREKDEWIATIRGCGGDETVRAKVIANATGPWASALFSRMGNTRPRRSIRLVKGSHVVLPRLYSGEHAFLIQNSDGRVVFAIPYQGEFTLVGTTELWWDGPPGAAVIDDAEIDYLLDIVDRTFEAKVSRAEIRWTYSGIRPLYDDRASKASAITRDYVLDLDKDGAPLLSVFGGKLTTYRRLAEQALDRLAFSFPEAGGAWTDNTVLPGGDLGTSIEEYSRTLETRYTFLRTGECRRLARSYGRRAEHLLRGAKSARDLGERFGADLSKREVDYLVEQEWARTAEDVLWRRTKLGLRLGTEEARRLDAYVRHRLAEGSP
jgi:glycerol-3-phosphate dehydrogenase